MIRKGNLTVNSSNAQSYVWDFDNRHAIGCDRQRTAAYTYDALGRRVSKLVNSGTSNMTTLYVPDRAQELAEYNTSGGTLPLANKYVYGDYIDEPVMMVNVSAGNEADYYFHQNNLYSVAVLTSQAGVVQEYYAYTAYGSPTILNSSLQAMPQSLVGNPYMYTGRRLDPETGLVYYRARYYDPGLGRFIGRDRIGYSGGVSLYVYVKDARLLLLIRPD